MAGLPTVTMMQHSTALSKKPKKRDVDSINDPIERLHDTEIIDAELPFETAQSLMLDLGLTIRNCQAKRFLVIASPFRRCVETAAVLAQALGIEGIYVHYGFCQNMITSLDGGWDWAQMPLVHSESELRGFVRQWSDHGVKTRELGPVSIAQFVGNRLTADDKNESELEYDDRVAAAIDDVRASIAGPGYHAVVVAHGETLRITAKKFANAELLTHEDCSYLTLAVPSDAAVWITSRYRLTISPP